MGYRMEQLPKKVASLVKKLAKLQREKFVYIKSSGGYKPDDNDSYVHMDRKGWNLEKALTMPF